MAKHHSNPPPRPPKPPKSNSIRLSDAQMSEPQASKEVESETPLPPLQPRQAHQIPPPLPPGTYFHQLNVFIVTQIKSKYLSEIECFRLFVFFSLLCTSLVTQQVGTFAVFSGQHIHSPPSTQQSIQQSQTQTQTPTPTPTETNNNNINR